MRFKLNKPSEIVVCSVKTNETKIGLLLTVNNGRAELTLNFDKSRADYGRPVTKDLITKRAQCMMEVLNNFTAGGMADVSVAQ